MSISIESHKIEAKKGGLQAAKQTVLKSCIKVRNQAIALADFEKGYQTGRTRTSISYSTELGSHGNSSLPKPQGSNTKAEGFTGTDVSYARYLEFGTRRMSAQPFLRPAAVALKGTKEDVKKAVQDAMSQYLKTFRKGGK